MTVIQALVLALTALTPMPSAAPPAYEEWHAVSLSGQEGLRRLAFAGVERGEPTFRLNGSGPSRRADEWLGGDKGLGPGFYFFETVDGRSPQGGGGELTPPVRLRCRGPGLVLQGFAYFNAERVSCRCWRRRMVDPLPRVAEHGMPKAHALGVIYNEGELVLSAGFRLLGRARAGGELRLSDRAEIQADAGMLLDAQRGRFPPPQWKVDVVAPQTWPYAEPGAQPGR